MFILGINWCRISVVMQVLVNSLMRVMSRVLVMGKYLFGLSLSFRVVFSIIMIRFMVLRIFKMGRKLGCWFMIRFILNWSKMFRMMSMSIEGILVLCDNFLKKNDKIRMIEVVMIKVYEDKVFIVVFYLDFSNFGQEILFCQLFNQVVEVLFFVQCQVYDLFFYFVGICFNLWLVLLVEVWNNEEQFF